MAKRKSKKTVDAPPPPQEPVETQYYWCVNCGHYGNYGKIRQRGLNCELCDYDSITPYSLEEINDPDMDCVWLERFQTKEQTAEEKLSQHHIEAMKVVKEAKEILNSKTKTESKTKSNKESKSVKDRIAEIRGQK